MTKPSWVLILALAGCATTTPQVEEVLETTNYTLTVVRHCPEGEVGCSRVTATLVDKRFEDRQELTGGTHMAMCADGVTPCHLGFYDLKAPNGWVRAYPDGSLEIKS